MSDPVEIVKYNPEWPRLAAQEISALRRFMTVADFPVIEHIGGTAIPGHDSKPVIDILIAAANMNDARRLMAQLAGAGYKFMEAASSDDYFFFVKGSPRTHHIYMLADGDEEIAKKISFRDILRQNKSLAREHQDLKYKLAAQFRDDRIAFTNGKAGSVEKILRA